jgi:hypothetical protein
MVGLGSAASLLLESQTDALSKLRKWVHQRTVIERIVLEVLIGKFLHGIRTSDTKNGGEMSLPCPGGA